MDTKYTPLQWEASKHGTPDYAPQFGIYAHGKPNDHCIVTGDNAEADAAFICLAVNNHYELLEACKVAEDCIRKIPAFGDSIGTEISKAQLGVAYNRLTTAIAHAEGTQQ